MSMTKGYTSGFLSLLTATVFDHNLEVGLIFLIVIALLAYSPVFLMFYL